MHRSCNHLHNQGIGRALSSPKSPIMYYHFIVILHSKPGTTTMPGKDYSIFNLCNFVILRILYNWNDTVCDILRLAFSLSFNIMPVSLMLVVEVSLAYSFLWLSHSPWFECTTVCLTNHPLIHILVASSLGLL